MSTQSIQINPTRDYFSALAWPRIAADTTSRHAKHLAAMIAWILSQAGITGNRDDYTAINVDLYSISAKHEAILYQHRVTEPGWRGHRSTRKTYYLAQWSKDAKNHIEEIEINAAKARSAVRLFEADPAGAVEYLLRKRAKPPAQKQPPIRGYKLVRVRLDELGTERYFSYFDGQTEYAIGQTVHQTAQSGHRGGLYCYLSRELCEPENIAVASNARIEDGEGLAVLEVTGTGKRIRYDRSGKYAVSTLVPIRVVRMITQPSLVAEDDYAYDYED